MRYFTFYFSGTLACGDCRFDKFDRLIKIFRKKKKKKQNIEHFFAEHPITNLKPSLQPKYICEICGKSFIQEKKMKSHKMSHYNIKKKSLNYSKRKSVGVKSSSQKNLDTLYATDPDESSSQKNPDALYATDPDESSSQKNPAVCTDCIKCSKCTKSEEQVTQIGKKKFTDKQLLNLLKNVLDTESKCDETDYIHFGKKYYRNRTKNHNT